jgi:16S rRNA (cytosine967-C5)-methyltransferase
VRAGKTFDRAREAVIPGLADRDRRLAHEIASGVLRHRRVLDRRITTILSQPKKGLSDDLRDVLRIGVYQLLYLDRVPAYAAVQSTVELAKGECGKRYGSLVNAVLRKASTAGPLDAGPEPTDLAGLAARHSHPEWLVARWLERFGTDRTGEILRHNNTPPPLVIQPAGWTPDRLQAAWQDAGIAYRSIDPDLGFAVEGGRVADLPGYTEGGFIVQDATQRKILDHVGVAAGDVVWDACAAPGGKAAILARTGTVLASDVARSRIGRLRENLRRISSSAFVAVADARFPPVRPDALEIVMIDAPCSATGTMARHPDARWRLSPGLIGEMAARQGEILRGAAHAVRPGGMLAYLTCSLEPEENERQVEDFLNAHTDFHREGDDLFVLPGHEGDGGFAARLRRAA